MQLDGRWTKCPKHELAQTEVIFAYGSSIRPPTLVYSVIQLWMEEYF